MTAGELFRRQWEGYPRYHRSRDNLRVHVMAVPLFLVGNVGLVWGLVAGSWEAAVVFTACMVVSLALQGRGHRGEENPPEPFTGPLNAFLRIFLEQWVTFPRFVLSGGWWRAMNESYTRK